MSRRNQGKLREEEAFRLFEKQGYHIIKKNYQKRSGEIDLIALDITENTLSFIEIRTRSHSAKEVFGPPFLTISSSKISKIKKLAGLFLQENPQLLKYPIRFDVLSGIIDFSGEIYWELLKDAFR